MKKTEIQAAIIAKHDELERLRVQQLANIHARNYYNAHDEEKRLLSEYFEINNRVKVVITELADIKQQLETAVVAEIKSTPIPSGWICPRCQKVHNWMIQSCDCYPSVITASTTEPIPENYLNDCIEKATPNLSKIKDVDKELAEIREEDKTCRNCRNKVLSPISKPCSYCLGFDEWEPIK